MRYRDIASAQTFLELDVHGNPADRRLRVCVLLLLWEVARADGEVSKEEFQEIIRQACHEFHLMDQEAGELVEVAACLDSEQPRFDEFIGEVNRRFDREQREHLFSLLVGVAKADRHYSMDEQSFLAVVRDKLNLPHN